MLLETHKTNAYVVERPSETKMVYQTPWYHDGGVFGGLVEFAFKVPKEMPNFVRPTPPSTQPAASATSSPTPIDPALAMPVFYTLAKLTN